MGSYDDFLGIYKYLRNDEQLLRLLYYPPEDIADGIKDPLSPTLSNILDRDPMELSKIRKEHIMKSLKSDDLVDKQICRIYIYAGRRTPENRNYAFADQQLHIDVLVHNDIENSDFRSNRINDTLNNLLISNNVAGIGKMEYYGGDIITVPKNYIGYKNVYSFGTFKRSAKK